MEHPLFQGKMHGFLQMFHYINPCDIPWFPVDVPVNSIHIISPPNPMKFIEMPSIPIFSAYAHSISR